jgi:hypothetical protein
MKYLRSKHPFGSWILRFGVLTCLILFSGCKSDSDTSQSISSDTGSINFNLVFQGVLSGDELRQQAQAPSGDVCVDYGIETVTADVYNSSDSVVASGSWPCSEHGGTISGVPPGSGMYVIIEGIVSGNTDWRGQSTTFTVSAGQTTDAGTITMNYIGTDVLIWDQGNWDEKNWS